MDEIFIITSGKSKISIDAEEAELERGDAVLTPMGHAHQLQNVGAEDVEYIVVGISLGKNGKTVVVE